MTTTYDDLFACEDGPRDAPPLLLLHGSGASVREWDPLVPLLTGAHRVIRTDLLGHGRSPKPVDGDYAVPAQARRVAAVLDRLGVERAVVAAHSSGGYTATALAEQYPGLVTALALIDTGPSLDAFIPQEGAVEPEQWPRLTDEQIRRMAGGAFSRPGFTVPPDVVSAVRAMTFHSFTATMAASNAYVGQRPVPDRLASAGRPLLVIFGADDRRWRPERAEDYRAVPDARIELLPGLGHSPNLEDPPRTAELLLAFTAAHTAPSS